MSDAPGPFRVVQFFEDELYEVVKTDLDAEQAVTLAAHLTKSVAARHGIVREVMITDANDECAFLWRFGEGVIFPTKEEVSGS